MNGEAKREVIRERLEALAQAGRLAPRDVVADARAKDSPLHECFEWDDKKAGSRYRLMQARRLIGSVQVVIVEETRVLSAVAYVRDPAASHGEQGYARTVEVRDDRERARMVLLTEAGRASAHLGRVRALASAFHMEDEAAGMLERLEVFREKVRVG